MEQTIELMRKRHAYYTRLITEHKIHTAREFYAELRELFAMFGVDVYLNEAETECTIAITCEDYDYEDYTVTDGKNGGLATISPIVSWKHPTYMCNDEVDIFAEDNRENSDYVTTGFADIDAMIGGWEKSSVSLIAARPAMGKSTFCHNMDLDIFRHEIPVALFSLEMSIPQIIERLACNIVCFNRDSIGCGDTNERMNRRLKIVENRLARASLYIDDTATISVAEIAAKIEEMIKEHGIKIVFIDYLQLLTSNGNFSTRKDEISSLLIDLSETAQQFSIPIVVICQLNRTSYDARNSKPDLTALHEIDASIPSAICFIHRPEYFATTKQEKEGETIEFIVAKSSKGNTGTIPLIYHPEYYQIDSVGNE